MIAFLGPFFGVKPPFTVLQLLWINVIMDTFAAIALCSEAPREGLMRMKPKRRDESIVTPAMRTTILLTAGFFVVVMMGVLLGMENGWLSANSGPNPERWEFAPLNIRQVSVFFTMYVMFQVWNMINCRSLSTETSGLSGFWRNRSFMGIMIAILIGQALHLGDRFRDRPLIVSTLWKSIVFGLLVAVFVVLEHVVTALLHHRPVASEFQFAGGQGYEMLARVQLMLVAFVPFFAFREISAFLGKGKLIELFFQGRGGGDAKASH